MLSTGKRVQGTHTRTSESTDVDAPQDIDGRVDGSAHAARGCSVRDEGEDPRGAKAGGKRKLSDDFVEDNAHDNVTVHEQQVKDHPSEGTITPY
jgi:hypothetical protein